MAYKEWVEITVLGVPGKIITVRNAHLSWGKFYATPNKDAELGAGEIDKLVLDHKHPAITIAACGRSGTASGTEGGFELVNFDGSLVARCGWNCPWGLLEPNSFSWHPQNGWSATITAERLVAGGDQEDFSTPKDPVVEQAEKIMTTDQHIPDQVREGASRVVLFRPETPGALGRVQVQLRHDGHQRVRLLRAAA